MSWFFSNFSPSQHIFDLFEVYVVLFYSLNFSILIKPILLILYIEDRLINLITVLGKVILGIFIYIFLVITFLWGTITIQTRWSFTKKAPEFLRDVDLKGSFVAFFQILLTFAISILVLLFIYGLSLIFTKKVYFINLITDTIIYNQDCLPVVLPYLLILWFTIIYFIIIIGFLEESSLNQKNLNFLWGLTLITLFVLILVFSVLYLVISTPKNVTGHVGVLNHYLILKPLTEWEVNYLVNEYLNSVIKNWDSSLYDHLKIQKWKSENSSQIAEFFVEGTERGAVKLKSFVEENMSEFIRDPEIIKPQKSLGESVLSRIARRLIVRPYFS